jgi:Protein of unknown function (DUF1236)
MKQVLCAALGVVITSVCASAQIAPRDFNAATAQANSNQDVMNRWPSAPAGGSVITQTPSGAPGKFVPPAAEAPVPAPAPTAAAPAPPPRTAETTEPAPARAAPARPVHRTARHTAPHRTAARTPKITRDARLAQARVTQRIVQEPLPPFGLPSVITEPAPAVATNNSFLPPFFQPLFPSASPPAVAMAEPPTPFGYAAAPTQPAIIAPPFATNAAVNYVGKRLPRSVQLYAVPDAVVAQAPALRRYRYAMVDDRMFLVDPATYRIVADVTR